MLSIQVVNSNTSEAKIEKIAQNSDAVIVPHRIVGAAAFCHVCIASNSTAREVAAKLGWEKVDPYPQGTICLLAKEGKDTVMAKLLEFFENRDL